MDFFKESQESNMEKTNIQQEREFLQNFKDFLENPPEGGFTEEQINTIQEAESVIFGTDEGEDDQWPDPERKVLKLR